MGVKVKVEVLLMDDGRVLVNGPLADKIPLLGLLKIAEQIVFSYNPQVVPAAVVPRG